MTHSFLPVRTRGGRSWGRPDRHLAHDASLFRPDRVHVQKPGLQKRSFHLQAVGEDEPPNENARGDAPTHLPPHPTLSLRSAPPTARHLTILPRPPHPCHGVT